MKKLVVLTGAGMSAESGIPTFRASDGLWENHRIEDVASPGGWHRNPELVLEFYNQRRKQVKDAQPNRGHQILAELEQHFDVQIITQNIDNLHERAGSSNVLHLHGEITKVRSSADENLIYDLGTYLPESNGWQLKLGDRCEKGSQLRPHIVWFGEAVPMIEVAVEISGRADIFVVVGTSLVVYPAAGLVNFAPRFCPKFIVDPRIPPVHDLENLTPIQEGAGKGIEILKAMLLG